MKKIKTLAEHVLEMGRPAGEVIEVEEHVAEHLISNGYAEEVKPAKKTQANKKKED